VGGAQLLLPAHVINEYCRPDRAFSPFPNFNQEGLLRVREVDGKAGSDVYTQQYNGETMGEKWGIYRGARGFLGVFSFLPKILYSDEASVAALSEARLQQQRLLMKDLLKNKPLLGNKG
jgi:hypothetical protein